MRFQNIFRFRGESLGGSRRGAVAVLFALTLVPLLIGAGMATDFARMQILKSSLQTIADGAALAGASQLNQNKVELTSQTQAVKIAKAYFNTGYAALTDSGTLTTLNVPQPTDSITVQVSATATLNMTLMSLFTSAQIINVYAKAQGPGYALQVVPGNGFTAGGADGNVIFYYDVPPGGGHPPINETSVSPPTFPGYTPLFSSPTPKWNYGNLPVNIVVPAGDKVGFALFNVTGAAASANYRNLYPTNSYGRPNDSQQGFFSNLAAPSMDPVGYPTQPAYNIYSNNCATKTAITWTTSTNLLPANDPCGSKLGYPCVTRVNGVSYQNNLMVGPLNGTPACSTPASATLTCLQLYQNPTTFSWGDMGGVGKGNPETDDFNYANITYTVQCMPNTTGTGSNGQPNAVVLVQ